MASAVIDASALLAVLFEESGCEAVIPYLADPIMSAVNLSEVVAKCVQQGKPLQETIRLLERFSLNVVPFDAKHGYIAASLAAKTQSKGLSFADRACLSLGLLRQTEIVTGDRRWAELDFGVTVRLFR